MDDRDLLIKIKIFLRKANSLQYLDPNIFDNIDKYRETIDVPFDDYFLEYVKELPKLDFEDTLKISREVYQMYGIEKDFDTILARLLNSHSIDKGSFNKDEEDCIANSSERSLLLSGTYYDVILLCHEFGHRLRCDNAFSSTDLMHSFFFETPSILLELAANNHLRDTYGVQISADDLRKTHILSDVRENSIDNDIFRVVINLLKDRNLNAQNLYEEFIKNPSVVEYLKRPDTSIKNSVDEGFYDYSYVIGYILGNYIIESGNVAQALKDILKYKDKGLTQLFTIDEEIIKKALENPKYTK